MTDFIDPTVGREEVSSSHPLPVGSIGNNNLVSGQVTVDTTSGGKLIVAARSGRNSVTIINEGTTDVRFGASGVTTGTGALLTGTKGASITLPTTGAVYGIVATGTQTVSYVETY